MASSAHLHITTHHASSEATAEKVIFVIESHPHAHTSESTHSERISLLHFRYIFTRFALLSLLVSSHTAHVHAASTEAKIIMIKHHPTALHTHLSHPHMAGSKTASKKVILVIKE